jgi:hypothetical protein
MLKLRSVIVLGVIGIALWGLFALLSKLKEPTLLRTSKATVISGCDGSSDDRKCDQLRCEKALIDTGVLGYRTQFAITVERGTSPDKLIGGRTLPSPAQIFACTLHGRKVTSAKLVTSAELAEMADQWQPVNSE